MGSGPNQDAIDGFVSVTNLPRSNAIEWLKAHSNDLNGALDAWLDNSAPLPPPKYAEAYNEHDFHAGNTAADQATSFPLHPPDTLQPNVFDGAPSRPPSRVSNTGGPVPVNGPAQNPNMTTGETEDEQMKRAMAMSLSESQTLPGQESGVMDYSKQSFGPATRQHYEAKDWSLTVPDAQTQEILLNPEPIDRRRQPGTPAFLKPSSSGPRLAAFLKMVHAVPIAREALLNREHLLPNYGHDNEWWDGTAIKVLRVVNVDQEVPDANQDDLIYETQRLMAFLDETERAYGSTDVLANLDCLSTSYNDIVAKFLEDWKVASEWHTNNAPLLGTFVSTGAKRSSDGDLEDNPSFPLLLVRVEEEIADKGLTLYEAMDELIGSYQDQDAYFQDLADVFTIEATNHSPNPSGLGIEVPAVWYFDRYLESFLETAKEMRARKNAVYAEMDEMNLAEERIRTFSKPGSQATLDAQALINKATIYFEQIAESENPFGDRAATNASPPTDGVPDRPNEALVELKALTSRIRTKLDSFEEARESARERLKEISKLYTEPTDGPGEELKHKYTLRGVSTNPHTVYMLEKVVVEAEDFDMLDAGSPDWQWWKLEYVSSDPRPVVTEKVKEADVLQAARIDSTSALLVYANEKAMSYPSGPLPPQLHDFTRADNLAFTSELSSTTAPLTPTKRKATTSSSPPDRQYRSPPPLLDSDLDPNPPGYYDSPSPSPPRNPPRMRPLAPKSKPVGADDMIPVMLQGSEGVHDLSASAVGEGGGGVEMQEKGGAGGGMFGAKSGSGGRGYRLGEYVPEIEMEDEDDDGEGEGEGRGG